MKHGPTSAAPRFPEKKPDLMGPSIGPRCPAPKDGRYAGMKSPSEVSGEGGTG